MMNRHYEYFIAILRKNDKNDKTLSSYFFLMFDKADYFYD